jgi:hypothetical protein
MNATHTIRHDELLPAFALGALDGDELREMEAHLAGGCPICNAELELLAADLEALALFAAEPLAPVTPVSQDGLTGQDTTETAEITDLTAIAELRRRVLAQVAAEPRPLPFAAARAARDQRDQRDQNASVRRAARSGAPSRWLQIAAAALLAVTVWGAARLARQGSEIERLRGERIQLTARAASLEHRMAEVQAESERLASSISIVTAPGVQLVSMSGMGSAQKATGRTYVNGADRKAVFYAYHLPALAANKSYQLWVIDNDERKVSVGLLQVDSRGEGSVVVNKLIPVDDIQAWVVTIEPHGGMPQPTGPIALAG